jgi:predicted nucleic acid-binding Zn ribbon protein
MADDPVPLRESLAGVVRSLRASDTGRGAAAVPVQALGGVFGRWNEAVGDAVAAHVQPVKLDGDRLVVEVDDPAWATQLKFLEATLRERLQQVTGASIRQFEIRVRR